MKKKIVSILMIMAMAATAATGCGSKDSVTQADKEKKEEKDVTSCPNEGDPIKVATMTDAEGGNLGKIIVLALEDAGYEVEDETQTLGSTTLLRDVETQKQADITVNYTGNGMYLMENEGDPAWQDYTKGYEKIRDFDKKENGLEWLTPAPANNSELLAVTKEFADENDIEDMYDFADYINNGGKIKLFTYEYWLEFEQGLPGFEKTYGFEIPEENILTGDIELTELAKGTDGLNCAMVFTTDGRIEELGLYVMKDPVGIPPVYSPAPIATSEVMEKYPEIADVLNPIFEGISTEDLVSMNCKSQSQGMPCEDVAKEYLESKGFLK